MKITRTSKMMDENEYWIVQPRAIPTKTRNAGGDINRSVSDSGDSIASVVVPRNALRLTRNSPFAIDQYRNVDAKDFFLCLCSILLLVSAIGLVGVSIWTLVTRIPYMYISEHISYLGIVSFTLSAGLLCFPSSWLAWGGHAQKSGYIQLLAVFLCVSIIMLATGTALGTVHRSRINFDWIVNNSSYKSFVIKNLTIYEESNHMNIYPRLQAGPYRSALNSSMVSSLYSYAKRSAIQYGWDTIHQRLRCCGVNSPSDWYSVRKNIPDSCCKKFHIYDVNNNHTEFYNKCELQNVYLEGCLDAVAYELAHYSAVLTSIGYVVLFLELLSLLIIMVMYVRMRMTERHRLQPSLSRVSYYYSATPRQSSYTYQQRLPMERNVIPPPQVYYRYIQPPPGTQLQQLQQQQLQQQQLQPQLLLQQPFQQQQLHQQSITPTISPAISAEITSQIKDNFELMHVPN